MRARSSPLITRIPLFSLFFIIFTAQIQDTQGLRVRNFNSKQVTVTGTLTPHINSHSHSHHRYRYNSLGVSNKASLGVGSPVRFRCSIPLYVTDRDETVTVPPASASVIVVPVTVPDRDGSPSQSISSNTSSSTSRSSVFPDPDILAVLTIYFVQGAIGLSRLAVSFFLKDTLHASPATAASIASLTTLPWLFKPLYGFLTDSFPIFGYRRRPYLLISGLLGAFSWLGLGLGWGSTEIAWVTACIVLGSASIAVSDVVADSMAVERSRTLNAPTNSDVLSTDTGASTPESTAGDLQSLCWLAAAVGSVLSAYFSGSLLERFTPQNVFLVTSVFPLLVAVAAMFTSERQISVSSNSDSSDSGISSLSDKENDIDSGKSDVSNDSHIISNPDNQKLSIQNQLQQLWTLLRQPTIFLPVLFVVLWEAMPSASTAMFYFTTNELHFPPEFLGRVQLAASLASLSGVLAYRRWFRDVGIKQLIIGATVASVPLSLVQLLLTTHANRQLGIPDEVIALADTAVLSALGQLAFMPTLVLASSLCPPGVEGTLFATLMSIYNAAGSVSTLSGGWLTSLLGVTESNFENLSLLLVICAVASVLPLAFIGWLDKREKLDNTSSADTPY